MPIESGSGADTVFRRILNVTLSAAVAVACNSLPASEDQPALLAEANDTNRAALQRAVNSAVGMDVLLADSAFTERSVLVIERRPRSTLDNPVPDGRTMATPIRLELVINAGRCILVDSRDGSRHPLEGASCIAHQAP
ncbi:MAG: hypothetical protein R3192_10840 [Woeseiaceae bacterium]|nr:hypothetical protein [Woeseiaceae bacterium]